MSTPKADLSLTDDDREVMRAALLALRDAGETPLIPADVDIDGDGIVDAFGLDENDEVVPVLSTPLEATCYVSEGDDVGER